MRDSETYINKKKSLSRMLTIFGRKPVLEALMDKQLSVVKLHLAESNKNAAIIDDILNIANARNIDIRYHTRDALSRISKNKKQDQGIAADLNLAGFVHLDDFLHAPPNKFELIALDNITNPQNLGMIIRSVCASPVDGILLPIKGCAKLDALVIKASSGTIFKAKIIRCDTLSTALKQLKNLPAEIISLDLTASDSLQNLSDKSSKVFVLGNETDGVSAQTSKLCDKFVRIPMQNNVESLNVAVTASLVAFRKVT